MSNKNFDRNTITNFVNGMKGHNDKIVFMYGPLQKGLNSYKKRIMAGQSGIETFKNLKKNVLMEIIKLSPGSEIAQKYNKFQFKDTADLKKEDLLNMLPLSDSLIRDLLDLVDNFCLDTKDFNEAKKIFSDICITTEKSDLRKVKLKFISKFKKNSLDWKQFKKIWAIGSNQQVDSEEVYFTGYVDLVYSALETIKENQSMAYDTGFIKNYVVNVLRPNNADVKTEEIQYQINHTESEERQQLGDYLFGVIYMMLIHSKEYLENRKMDALNDFFGGNKKGSFSSEIGSNILELIKCGFVGALSIVYLNDGYFEKSQNEYVVKLREILKENKCELKIENDEKGNQKIAFKNNQEKIVEQPLENMEGKIMSDKNFDEQTIKAFVDSMKDGQGKSLVKVGPWKSGLNAYKQKNKNLSVTEIAKVKNLKKDVLMEIIKLKPESDIAKKYAEFQFKDTKSFKKEDLLNMLPLSVKYIGYLLDLVSVSCLSAEDFEEAKKIFFNIHNDDACNDLSLVKLKFISKFKKGSLTWQQWKQVEGTWSTWITDGSHNHDISLKFNHIDVVYLALEAFKEDSEISFGDEIIMFNILMGHFWDAGNKKVEDPESLKIEDIQKLGDCLFGVIYMLLIHSKEYLEDRKMDALNGFFGQCEANTFSGATKFNLLELLDATFAEKLAVLYLNNGYFKTSKNEYVIKLREMLEENKCELKVEKDEKGQSKIVFKNNQEKTVEQSLSISEQTEQKEQGINNSANSDDKKSNEKKLKWKGNENSDKDKNNIAGNEEEEKPKIVPVKNNQEQIVQKAEGGELKTHRKKFENFKIENGELVPYPAIFKIENGELILNNTQTGIHNKNENENKEESKTPIWLVFLEKTAYIFLCVFTLGAPLWGPPLIKKLFPDPKISELDQNNVDKSILPNASEVKSKDENMSQDIKLEDDNKIEI